MKVGINGFGRIGRALLRALYEKEYKNHGIEVVAINSRSGAKQQAHLLRYDSIHGIFQYYVDFTDSSISVNDDVIRVFNEAKPGDIPWDVDVVFECSGVFNSKDKAGRHKADKIIVSAPVSDADQTIIYGVNHDNLDKSNKVISCGSCTTNCLAPIADVIHKKIGIEHGFMTTVHAYTNDQNVIDNSHKDLRRARACAISMIPTSTGAAKTIGKIIPDLTGKIDGTAVRVPVPNVSMIDFAFVSTTKTTISAVNEFMENAASQELKNILGISSEPLVSVDFIHDSHSAIFDSTETKIVGDNFVRVLAWYDNEWGFVNRMIDVSLLLK
ncbi:MAG: type I glyceraldehyde-3-phosphate dehydrogenase [Rickettsiaceae bacterium H1]|nr:type I glyceraldehyde-3-phosphate dehydrogenase [Rickettsiaceae bacterium H1]